MEKTRRFRIPLRPVMLLFGAAAVAANLPLGWIYAQSPEDRRAEVFSGFINLSAGVDETAFLSDITRLTGMARRIGQDQLRRVHGSVIQAYAEALDWSTERLQEAVVDPNQSTPFDLVLPDFDGSNLGPQFRPEFLRHGQAGPWGWGVVRARAQDLPVNSEGIRPCAISLVYWTQDEWYFAPIGRQDLDVMLRHAMPDLAQVPLARLPRCDDDV